LGTEIGILLNEVQTNYVNSSNRSLSEISKNQLILVSEPANLKAALKQVQEVHAKAIEGWMLALQWEHERRNSDKALRNKKNKNNAIVACGCKVENHDSEKNLDPTLNALE